MWTRTKVWVCECIFLVFRPSSKWKMQIFQFGRKSLVGEITVNLPTILLFDSEYKLNQAADEIRHLSCHLFFSFGICFFYAIASSCNTTVCWCYCSVCVRAKGVKIWKKGNLQGKPNIFPFQLPICNSSIQYFVKS